MTTEIIILSIVFLLLILISIFNRGKIVDERKKDNKTTYKRRKTDID